MTIFTYRLKHDTGFAPNPFHNTLTLATCKPGIRSTKKIGHWIAGFSSLELANNAAQQGVPIGRNALIYLAQISDVMSLDDYYNDKRYGKKIPPQHYNGDAISCAGDNIYCPDPTEPDGYRQISQIHHDSDSKMTDISGVNALICEEFYYLGREGREIPENISVRVPPGPANYGWKTDNPIAEQSLLQWVRENFGRGQLGFPCLWDGPKTLRSRCSE